MSLERKLVLLRCGLGAGGWCWRRRRRCWILTISAMAATSRAMHLGSKVAQTKSNDSGISKSRCSVRCRERWASTMRNHSLAMVQSSGVAFWYVSLLDPPSPMALRNNPRGEGSFSTFRIGFWVLYFVVETGVLLFSSFSTFCVGFWVLYFVVETSVLLFCGCCCCCCCCCCSGVVDVRFGKRLEGRL